MNRGLYVAASGMLAMQARQDQLSNDLANAATPGYKQDRTAQKAFGELLVRNVQGNQQVGTMAAGVRLEEQTTDLRAAPLRQTDEPLDLAVDGEGYFGVQTDQGVRYTRNGRFTSAADGTLVDQMGNKVLGPDNQPVKLKADGTVDAAAVGVFALTDAVKSGDGQFTGRAGGQATGKVRAGELEGSGVDAARTMVEMMASLRAYEAGQKALTTIDDTLGKAAGLGSIR
jgi:flagellar basal-body rod protein FlgF